MPETGYTNQKLRQKFQLMAQHQTHELKRQALSRKFLVQTILKLVAGNVTTMLNVIFGHLKENKTLINKQKTVETTAIDVDFSLKTLAI